LSLRESVRSTTVADRVLLLLLLCISCSGFLLTKEVLSRASGVSVEIDGKVRYRYSLDTDRKVYVEGSHGHLTVEIKDREVRVIDASCPNKLCERQGWIKSGAIICLPSRISVAVRGPERSRGGRPDAITG
jgi:hypothetical protein